MIYYFLPDPGIFGGVKVACHFIEMLISLGARAAVVLPVGIAPHWFRVSVPVLREETVLPLIKKDDWVMITWPPDYSRLKALDLRLVCHCQGTDELMDEIFADKSVPILACWKQAAQYVLQKFDRSTTHVGISISDCFFYDGTTKLDNRVGYMPRRGFPIVRACMRRCRKLDFDPLDGLDEGQVGIRLKQSGVFVATSVGEQFGLPALEAMAAGCAVISVPVKGGLEYLFHGKNCFIANPDKLPETLRWISSPGNYSLRIRLRTQAIATALRYRKAAQLNLLTNLARTELKGLFI